MKFGVREICDVVFRAKAAQKIGNRQFYKNEPVIYFDTLRTSSLEGAATTVYAQGGRGYSRLIAWEGERTLTFTMEDALISPEGFSILSGAGLIDATEDEPIYVHTTAQVEVETANTIVVPDLACWNKEGETPEGYYHAAADIFVMVLDDNGEVAAEPCVPVTVTHGTDESTLTCYSHAGTLAAGSIVLVDYYVKRMGGAQQIEITPDKFGGYFYVEASTLFRRQADGVDMPAEFIIPNCKIQSNFTFTMAASGDPSTFTFTLDAFPDYTKFNRTKKVLACLQVISDADDNADATREPCQEGMVTGGGQVATQAFNYAGYGNSGLSIVKSGTDKDVQLTVTGSNVVSGADVSYDAATFEGLASGVDVVEVDLKLPVSAGKTYTITQVNPGFAEFYPDSFPDNTKTKDYSGDELITEDFQVLICEGQDPVTLTVVDKDTAETVFTATITSRVTFAA